MTVPVTVVFNGEIGKITNHGELVTGSLEHSAPYFAELNAASTTNVVPARSKEAFIITDIIVAQDRTNVDTAVSIFEADSADGASTRIILDVDVAKSQILPLIGLNMETRTNKFINFSSDSASSTIKVTVMRYYVPV